MKKQKIKNGYEKQQWKKQIKKKIENEKQKWETTYAKHKIKNG